MGHVAWFKMNEWMNEWIIGGSWLLDKSFNAIDLFLTYRPDSTDCLTVNVFILLNCWICLHGVLD